MNYTEMLFNRDEKLVNLLNQADSKNLELIEEINKKEDEIERLNNIIQKAIKKLENEIRYLKHLDEIGAMCSTEQVSFNNSLLKELKGSEKE